MAERASFMVNLGQLLNQMATPEDLGKRMSQGLSLTCWVDVATGTLGFDLNGRDTGIRFQVSFFAIHQDVLISQLLYPVRGWRPQLFCAVS